MLDLSSGEKMDEFEQSLANCKRKIESGATIQTAVVSLRAAQKIDLVRTYLLYFSELQGVG